LDTGIGPELRICGFVGQGQRLIDAYFEVIADEIDVFLAIPCQYVGEEEVRLRSPLRT